MSTRARTRHGRRQHRHEHRHTLDQYDAPHHTDSMHQRKETLEMSQNRRCNPDELEHSRRSSLRVLKSLRESPSGRERSVHVERWLGQVDELRENNGKENRSYIDQGYPCAHSKQAAIAQLQSLQNMSHYREHRPSKSKRASASPKHHTSSQLSFQQLIKRPQCSRELRKVLLENTEKRPSKQQLSCHKRRRSLEKSVSSEEESTQPNEVFHKRQRHKTKENRYETKNHKGRSKGAEKIAKPQSKKSQRRDAVKISPAAGKELISHFASNKIAQDRLTMRPEMGIFRNGKASSLTRKRGISDLAFSEMDFLSNSKAKPGATENQAVAFKHGQKMQRERKRMRNEISKYFAPRQAAHAVNTHQQPAASFPPRSEKDSTVASSDSEGTSYGHKEYPAQLSIDKNQFLGFGATISSPTKTLFPAASQQPIYVRPSVEADLSTSSSSTNYASWPLSAHSDSSSIRSEKGIPDSSSSPSVLRRRLLDSGVFNRIGVGRSEVSASNAQSHRLLLPRDDNFTKDIQPRESRYMSAATKASATPISYQITDCRRSYSHRGLLRRRQIEAARCAIESNRYADVQDWQDSGVPHSMLVRGAFLSSPSSVPRRPATTTPMQQSSQNRVHGCSGRSSLQHEILREAQQRDVQPQLSEATLHDVEATGHGAAIWGGQYINFATHTVTPNYMEYDSPGQSGAEGCMAAHADNETPAVDHGDLLAESGPSYCAFDDIEGTQYEQEFAEYQQYYPDQQHHQEDIRREVLEVEHPVPDYEDQPSQLHDQLNQSFQTARWQSYLRQRCPGSPNFQDTSCQLGEDQWKGFWAAKRW